MVRIGEYVEVHRGGSNEDGWILVGRIMDLRLNGPKVQTPYMWLWVLCQVLYIHKL